MYKYLCSPYMLRRIGSGNLLHNAGRFPFTTHSFSLTFSLQRISMTIQTKLRVLTTHCYGSHKRTVIKHRFTLRHCYTVAFTDVKTMYEWPMSLLVLLSLREGRRIMSPISSPQHVPTGEPSPVSTGKNDQSWDFTLEQLRMAVILEHLSTCPVLK